MSRWLMVSAVLLLSTEVRAESSNLTTSFTDRLSSTAVSRPKMKASKDVFEANSRAGSPFKLGTLLEHLLAKAEGSPTSAPAGPQSRDLGGCTLPGVMAAVGRNSVARSLFSLMGPFMLGAIMTAPLIAPSALLALGALGPILGGGGGIFRRKRELHRSVREVEQTITQQMKRIIEELDDFLTVPAKGVGAKKTKN